MSEATIFSILLAYPLTDYKFDVFFRNERFGASPHASITRQIGVSKSKRVVNLPDGVSLLHLLFIFVKITKAFDYYSSFFRWIEVSSFLRRSVDLSSRYGDRALFIFNRVHDILTKLMEKNLVGLNLVLLASKVPHPTVDYYSGSLYLNLESTSVLFDILWNEKFFYLIEITLVVANSLKNLLGVPPIT